MITVKLKGGMGNQMFQYALGRALSIKHNVPLKLDIEIYGNNLTKRIYALDVFNIKAEVAKKDELPLSFRTHIKNILLLFRFDKNEYFKRLLIKIKKRNENFFHFDSCILNIGSNVYLDGYWQSPKYFNEIEEIIKKDFTLKNPLSKNIQDLMNEIKNQKSLCIHVRRRDFVGNSFHETVGREYYNNGIEKIETLTRIDKIYVFSDDIEWCKENLTFLYPTMFVGQEYSGDKDQGNLALMSVCHHFIIPNSTFSWWGAWLSSYKDKIVIAPKKWFNDGSIDSSDLIPKEWIRI